MASFCSFQFLGECGIVGDSFLNLEWWERRGCDCVYQRRNELWDKSGIMAIRWDEWLWLRKVREKRRERKGGREKEAFLTGVLDSVLSGDQILLGYYIRMNEEWEAIILEWMKSEMLTLELPNRAMVSVLLSVCVCVIML